jgi:predicted lipoprotein
VAVSVEENGRLMMKPILFTTGLVVALSLSGCKLVKTQSAEEAAVDPIATLVSETFDAKLVPALSEKAVDLSALHDAVKAGLDDAGAKYGLRVGGAGGGWNFAVKGKGKVVAENRASKAAVADVDLDGDGTADVTLQLGPVVKGSALRDATALYDFSAFRDQIEYARLGRALNDRAVSALSAGSALNGKTVQFVGATVLRSAGEKPLVTPVSIEVVP